MLFGVKMEASMAGERKHCCFFGLRIVMMVGAVTNSVWGEERKFPKFLGISSLFDAKLR